MVDALIVLTSFGLGAFVAWIVLQKLLGAKRFSAGYMAGFNAAWDQRSDFERLQKEQAQKEQAKRLAELRRRGPKLQVVRGEKE